MKQKSENQSESRIRRNCHSNYNQTETESGALIFQHARTETFLKANNWHAPWHDEIRQPELCFVAAIRLILMAV